MTPTENPAPQKHMEKPHIGNKHGTQKPRLPRFFLSLDELEH